MDEKIFMVVITFPVSRIVITKTIKNMLGKFLLIEADGFLDSNSIMIFDYIIVFKIHQKVNPNGKFTKENINNSIMKHMDCNFVLMRIEEMPKEIANKMSTPQNKIYMFILSLAKYHFNVNDTRNDSLTRPFNYDYNNFINHNINCIINLSKNDAKWYAKLCDKMMFDKDIGIVDPECYSNWNAEWIYFDIYGRINIVHNK